MYPAAGPSDKHVYIHERPFKNINQWLVAGLVQEASFLVNFAHAKGHPSCGYGGAIKNLALGCMAGKTRGMMHDAMQFDPYWFPELCPDEATRERIKAACPHEALVDDKQRAGYLHLHPEQCNACGRCLQVAPPGSLKIEAVNFRGLHGSLRHQHPAHALDLCAGQSGAPVPGEPDDAGVRLFWFHQHADPAGCGHFWLG